jgi:chemotaxis protein histidine kinase CheA
MANKDIKITLKIDGIEKEIENIDQLEKELKDLGKETKKAGEQQGFFAKKTEEIKDRMNEFKATLGEVGQGFKNGFKNLKQFVSGFKTAGGAVKNFGTLAKGAIAATGIGLLVVAVVSLIEYFKNLEGGAKTLKKVMAGLGATVTGISTAFSKLIRGDFAGAKEAIMGIKDAVVEATEAVDDQFEAEKRLSELRQQTIIQNALLNQEIEKQKKILEDTTLTTEQRLAALDKITEATKQLAINQKEETEQLLAKAEAELENINNYEERRQKQEEIAQLQADLIDQTTQLSNIEYDAARVAREIRAADLEDRKRVEAEKAALEEEAFQRYKEDYEKRKQMEKDQLKASMDAILARQKAEAQAANTTNKTEQLIAETKVAVAQDAFGALQQIAGEQSAIGKAAAISSATINTYQAATNALANTPAPPPFPQIAAAATIASGLAQVRNILKTPDVNGSTGGAAPSAPTIRPFDPLQSGFGGTGSQSAGATQTYEQTGSTGAIKAYVVASDMTSAQEADKKINDLATL